MTTTGDVFYIELISLKNILNNILFIFCYLFQKALLSLLKEEEMLYICFLILTSLLVTLA